jgi:prepilin-type processing-associated H-X9-DG protein
VLISILLPTIRGARRQANLVQCASNLRTLVQACQMHAQEHGGFLPLAGYVAADPSSGSADFPTGLNDARRRRYSYAKAPGIITFNVVPLPAALAPYLGVFNLPDNDWQAMDQALNAPDGVWRRFMCPSSDALEKGKLNSDPNDQNRVDQGTMMVTDVGFGAASGWATNSDYGFNEGVLGFHFNRRYAENRLGGQLTKVRRSSEVALFTDAIPRKAPSMPGFPPGWICWTPSLTGTGMATLGDAFAGNGRVEAKDSFDLYRHAKRINVGYVDGHVETVPMAQENLDKVYLIPPQ